LKNHCENANTHAHDGVHLVVLAHLRRRWSLSGREGFGVFEKMKCLFSIALEARKGGESLEFLSLKNSNRTLDRTRSRVDLRVRSVQTAGRDAHVKVVDRRVRSLTESQRPVMHPVGSACLNADRTWWRIWSPATGRVRSREELFGLRSDVGCSASDQMV
jgi:hypothetical protein